MARHFIDLTTAKSRGNVTPLTIETIYGQANNPCYLVKSRSDSILLIVGFNLRARSAISSPKSRRDDTLLRLTTKTKCYELR